MLSRLLLLLALTACLASCATGVHTEPDSGTARLAFQNHALNPRNGGVLITALDLRPGDILLSSNNGISSVGVRLMTLSPVSHASLYVEGDEVAEAVGQGIQRRSLAAALAQRMEAFVQQHVGQKYNFVGVILQAPFSIERRLCELPLVPPRVRDFCVQGVAAIQLGMGRNDQFFCSQFVLEAYRRAGLPLTEADPLLFSPGDLLHMREGDVPSLRIHQALQYVGHLKYQPSPSL
jgi:hypothetical protein